MKRTIALLLTLPLFFAATAAAETLGDKLSSGQLDAITQSVTVKPQETTPEHEKLEKLTDRPPQPIDGITVHVMDLNVGGNGSVSVDYAPEIKHGDLLDNKEQTTVNYKLKF